MPVRSQPIDSNEAAFELVGRRLRNIEEALQARLIPPGYRVNIVAGDLVITRTSDGATATLAFT